MPEGFIYYEALKEVADVTAAMTDGRLKINHFPGGVIAGWGDIMTSVSKGVLDGSLVPIGEGEGVLGKAAVIMTGGTAGLMLPDEANVWMNSVGMQLAQKLYDKKGYNIHVVGPAAFQLPELAGWFTQPATTLDIYKGMRLRTSGYWGDVLVKLGASIVNIPGGELYEAMKRGIIDAFEYSSPSADWAAGFHELGFYAHGPGFHQPSDTYPLNVNTRQWNKLSPDLKAILESATAATALRMQARWANKDAEALEKMSQYGIKFITIPDDIQKKVMQMLNQMWDAQAAKDADFKEVLEAQRKFLYEYRGLKEYVWPDYTILGGSNIKQYGQ
ncbi:MAG: TRAP transporter substrate-binding protein DctP [Dehalococcoidales bacterium]|nr:TRAP transporter substrate-binding protein DctP [Dehalococcoidales bacterium]